MSSAEGVYYKLKSSDGEVLQISKNASQLSGMLKTLLEINLIGDEEGKTMEPIDLPNVSGKVTKQIIQWCEDHTPVINDVSDDESSTDEEVAEEEDEKIREKEKALLRKMREKEKALLADLDGEELLQLFMGANYLDIKCLRGIILKIVAALISRKKYKEIRELWQLKSDFTPEEEKEMTTIDAWDLLRREMEKLEKEEAEEAAGDVAR